MYRCGSTAKARGQHSRVCPFCRYLKSRPSLPFALFGRTPCPRAWSLAIEQGIAGELAGLHAKHLARVDAGLYSTSKPDKTKRTANTIEDGILLSYISK